jgi:hypothetical protein
MAGKHRLRNRRVQRTTRHRAIEVVDARTLTTHFLTADALAAGWTRGFSRCTTRSLVMITVHGAVEPCLMNRLIIKFVRSATASG